MRDCVVETPLAVVVIEELSAKPPEVDVGVVLVMIISVEEVALLEVEVGKSPVTEELSIGAWKSGLSASVARTWLAHAVPAMAPTCTAVQS